MLSMISGRHGPVSGERGFALVAMVVALVGFLAVIFVMSAMAFLDVTVSKEDETKRRLAKLVEVIAGVPEAMPALSQGTHGFIGDVGRLPKSLGELNATAGPHTLCDTGSVNPLVLAFDPAAPPVFHTTDSGTNHRGKVGMGWQGPYFREMIFSDEYLRDAWGVAFRYTCPESTRTEAGVSLTVRTAQLTSAGKDGLFDTADDIKAEEFHDRCHLFLTVTQGGADHTAVNVEATLYYTSNGEQASLTADPATVSGPEGSEVTMVFPSIPAGIRFGQVDFGGHIKQLHYLFLKSNIANRINIKIPVGQGGKA